MSKDPAFLFYPGDYLRDTQCLSVLSQVAYNRIMCEHMRNICISQKQLNFFTKDLSEDEKEELLTVLSKTQEGYQIEWVAESISKRKAYGESRAKNRTKNTTDIKNISKTHVEHVLTYDEHMVNENENVIENINVIEIEKKIENGNVIENENENEKGVQGGKPIPLLERFKNSYSDFIKTRSGVPPKLDGVQVNAAKSIIAFLKTLDKISDDEGVLLAWSYILRNWHKLNEYQGSRLKLSEINSDLTKIIDQIKNPKTNGKQAPTFEEAIAARFPNLWRKNTRNNGC